MRVGFDATLAGISGGERGGVYQYIAHLLRAMAAADPGSEFRLLFGLPLPRHDATIAGFVSGLDRPNLRAVRARLPNRWLHRLPVPAEACLGRIDVVHGPFQLVPRTWRAATVVTVHDLAFLKDRAETGTLASLGGEARARHGTRQRTFADLTTHLADSVARAARVIAVSADTARDLETTLGTPPGKIRVIHNGTRPDVSRVGAAERDRTLRGLGLEAGYWLYLGVIDPNKNLPVLIEGFARFRRRGGRGPLVLAGRSEWYGATLDRLVAALGIGDAVRPLGFVPDGALSGLYAGARAVVMPSPLEGFGLPAIEAMVCGVPVIAADGGALPEVVGDAALLVDPDDPEAFAEALAAIEGDPALASRLVRSGEVQAQRFSWDRAATETLAVYREAIALGGSARS